MENFKSIVISIIILGILACGIYWAISTIQSGGDYDNTQEKKELEQKNEELKTEIAQLKDEINELKSRAEIALEKEPATNPVVKNVVEPAKTTTPVKTTTTSKYQDLINNLQKLVNDNVTLKDGSQGTRVGVVQNFLNIYNKTSNRIDNDYGATTKKLVIAFQKAQGLTSDGEAGPGTFRKMIDWLKKQ